MRKREIRRKRGQKLCELAGYKQGEGDEVTAPNGIRYGGYTDINPYLPRNGWKFALDIFRQLYDMPPPFGAVVEEILREWAMDILIEPSGRYEALDEIYSAAVLHGMIVDEGAT